MPTNDAENQGAEELEETLRDQAEQSRAHAPASDAAMAETVDFDKLRRAMDGKGEEKKTAAAPSDSERVQEAERQVLRAHAELENFRKRMQRDSDQQLKYANLPLMRELLDVVDNLNRAMEVGRGDAASGAALLSGVEMVSQQLSAVLEKFGCKQVEALGNTFDPNFHEAISQTASDEYAAGVVAQEVAVGYVLHDRVVRPSSVIVSTGPATQ